MAPKGRKNADKKVTKKPEKDAATDVNAPLEGETPADAIRRNGVVTTFANSSKTMHENNRDITVSNLTVTFHGTPLLEDTEFTLNYGNRYGYIGRNGCGKSTFMKVIAARCFPIPKGIDIFHLSEEIEATEMTAKEAVMSVDVERQKMEKEADELNDFLATEEGTEKADAAMERLTQVYERLEEMDAATAEVRCSKILTGLGFTPSMQNKKTKDFSGGWRMRIALARALFIQPTLLLLDEPTNHLDMEAVVWLEDYLSKWEKILFMVSHSQDFMNNVCSHIVHHQKKNLNYYGGNYDSFVNTRTEKEDEQEKRFKAEQDQIQHMKNYVAKFGQGNAKMARQAQSKEKTLDKMIKGGLTEKVEQERALDFKFPNPTKLPPPVLQCTDIAFGYPGCPVLYSGVDFGVDLDSRVALVGPNGAGKSTLLKIMTGELLPLTGSVRPHAHLRISKFTQHFIDVLDLTKSPLDYFLSLWTDLTLVEGRKFLGRFGISGSVQTQEMSQLSDGQKSRVVLAKMAKENPHLLFLDEPTNHLDMESIDSLAKAINAFEGGMVLVSHDMRLINQVAKEIWLCDNKSVMKYCGEISDFKKLLRKQMSLDSGSKGPSIRVVPLAPKKNFSSSSEPVPTMAPPAVPTKADFPSLGSSGNTSLSEEERLRERLRQARLELADLAIAKQRERQAKEKEENQASGEASGEAEEQQNSGEADDQENLKDVEKALAKEKRRQEKETIAAQKQKEEEDRQKRKEEKQRDLEEARILAEKKAKEHKEFLEQKAIRDAKKKAIEDEEEEELQQAIAQRRVEREARRVEKLAQKKAMQEAALRAFNKEVEDDVWTQEQQVRFETALIDPSVIELDDKYERWTRIAEMVGDGKTKSQCLSRYKYIKNHFLDLVRKSLNV